MQFMEEILLKLGMETNNLGSTDAAPGVPHSRPTQRDEATSKGRRGPRVRPRRATAFYNRFALWHLKGVIE